ncbi:MAG: DUF2335 domain-containing protein [Chitinispirillales bacterium]|jgi:uncharacterized membrane protein|nr:DUF2335 domain-containing protein [Chitinispirillales bacterium]
MSNLPESGSDNLPEDGNGDRHETQKLDVSANDKTLSFKAHSSSLPLAEEMERYERLLSGATDRILSMTEKTLAYKISESEKRLQYTREYQNTELKLRFKVEMSGQLLALLVVLVVVGAGIVCAVLNLPIASYAAPVILALGTLVGAIRGSNKQGK